MLYIGVLFATLVVPFAQGLLQNATVRSLEQMGNGVTISYRVYFLGDAHFESGRLYAPIARMPYIGEKRTPLWLKAPLLDFVLPVVAVHMPRHATDDDASQLRNFSRLRELNLAYCFNISDESVRHLQSIPSLEVLRLYRNDPDSQNNFTPKTFDPATQPRITDKSLEYLSKMKNLRELYLWDNAFSGDGLLMLRELTGLRVLRFRSPNISPKTILLLRSALPGTLIKDDST